MQVEESIPGTSHAGTNGFCGSLGLLPPAAGCLPSQSLVGGKKQGGERGGQVSMQKKRFMHQ